MTDKCSKCGSGDVTMTYHKAGCTHAHCTSCHDSPRCQGGSVQHMVRHCRRCHFEWYEAPLDSNSVIVTYATTAGSPDRLPSSFKSGARTKGGSA